MSILLVQLGDIHILSEDDPVLERMPTILNAAAAEATCDVEICRILVTGDATQNGSAESFALAANFLVSIKNGLADRLNCPVEIVAIPGNHDLDLSGDQAARDQIISGLPDTTVPPKSILDIALNPLSGFFEFAASLSPVDAIISEDFAFFRTVRLDVRGGTLDLHLFNSAWMSTRSEMANSLLFPLEKIDLPTAPADFSISLIHHPFNWFRQPDAMRPLREQIEQASDLVITGHEHGNAASERYDLGSPGLNQCLEGGVLQERSDPTVSSFSVITIDLENEQQQLVRLKLNDHGEYLRMGGSDPQPLRRNLARSDRKYRLSEVFQEFLNDPDLPFADSAQRPVRLHDFFTYPDLREEVGNVERRWRRIKGDSIIEEILSRNRVLISSSSKGGKTSLAKALFTDLLSRGWLPIYIDTSLTPKNISDLVARQIIEKTIRYQYDGFSLEGYEQHEIAKRAIIIDDLHGMSNERDGRDRFIKYANGSFGLVVALADIEFVLEEIHARPGQRELLIDYDRMQICEFGYVRSEELARKWLSKCRADSNALAQTDVKRIYTLVERVLKVSAIPHHPWVLIVLLQNADSDDAPAAKNGSYGHLYQAVITSALSRSQLRSIDIQGKYTYLGELAYAMHLRDIAVLDEAEARDFHNLHCAKYDLPLKYDETISDLVNTHILRRDGGRIAFRAKYSFSFFVAWHLSRNIHEEYARETIEQLCEGLHHDDSANVFVFLAHLSNDPLILSTIKGTAAGLFADAAPTDLEDDIEVLNLLKPAEIRVRLPSTDPEENRLRDLERNDESRVEREYSDTDGREVKPKAPTRQSRKDENLTTFLWDVRATVKTIEILGQVLRNGATSISADEKQKITEEIFRLARRLIGFLLQDLPDQLPSWAYVLVRQYEEEDPCEEDEKRLQRVINHIFNTYWFLISNMTRHVSHAVAHEMLLLTFDRVVKSDYCVPNRLFDLSIQLDLARSLPVNKACEFFNEVEGNILARSVIHTLVAHHLYLYRVPHHDRQAVCAKLGIQYEVDQLDPLRKKMSGTLQSEKASHDRRARRKDERQRKAANRRRRGK